MGNEQSNTSERKPDYKVYKIVRIDDDISASGSWTRYYLNDFVPYKDGYYKYIDFDKPPTLLTALATLGGGNDRPSLYEGKHIAIDTNITRERKVITSFTINLAKDLGCRESFLGDGAFKDYIRELEEIREFRVSAREWSDFDKMVQQAWQLEPPK